MIGALPLLLDLDKQPILERWTSDEEDKSSDEEEEFPELNGPFCAEQGNYFHSLQSPQAHPAPGDWGISLTLSWAASSVECSLCSSVVTSTPGPSCFQSATQEGGICVTLPAWHIVPGGDMFTFHQPQGHLLAMIK